MRKKRFARPGSRELYTRMGKAATLLKRAEQLAPWFYIGDRDDGPAIGALLDDAMIELWHAKQALLADLSRTSQAGEQTELDLTAPLVSAVCAACGHRSVDHTDGEPCPACGCTDFTEAQEEGR